MLFLKWKTFNTLQLTGRELDQRAFDANEKREFEKSGANEWQSFLDTGAVVVISPNDANDNIKRPHILKTDEIC